MTAIYALEQSRELVRMGWCQMHGAEDVNGFEVEADDERAVKFCSTTSVAIATWSFDNPVLREAFEYLVQAIRELYGWDRSDELDVKIIQDWNDEPERSKEEVVAVFSAAIELAKEA